MDKEQIAIERLKTASEMSIALYQKPLIVCHSGGKDSVVVAELAKRAGVPFELLHNHTTVDAPQTVRFVRSEFKRWEDAGVICRIEYPYYKGKRTSMWGLIVQKLMPPTRRVRYCCSVLKENSVKDGFIATGVRWAESSARQNRGSYEIIGRTKQEGIVMQNDNDEMRSLFENCQIKRKRVVNPIIDWTDYDVWEYIRSGKLRCNPLYNAFGRVGCIGCPMAGKKRYTEFARYPKYEAAYIRAFGHMLDARKAAGKGNLSWKTPQAVFEWWMEDENADGQTDLFGGVKGEEE